MINFDCLLFLGLFRWCFIVWTTLLPFSFSSMTFSLRVFVSMFFVGGGGFPLLLWFLFLFISVSSCSSCGHFAEFWSFTSSVLLFFGPPPQQFVLFGQLKLGPVFLPALEPWIGMTNMKTGNKQKMAEDPRFWTPFLRVCLLIGVKLLKNVTKIRFSIRFIVMQDCEDKK